MEVKWIKLMVDMFDNRKIRYLRKLPDGNSIVLIWVMLLSLAGRCNAGGMIHLTKDIPYTPKMLADELDFEENTVVLALGALENLGMISQNPLTITSWEEYQSTDRLSELREYNRLAQQKSRAKRKELAGVNDMSMTSQRCHDTDIDIDRDIDVEVEGDKETIRNLSLSERKKEKRKKEDAEPQRISDEVSRLRASEAFSVFRSFLEREYRKLSPDLRNQLKDTYGGYMDVIRGYLISKSDMTREDAESVCSLLDVLYHGDVAGWIGMLRIAVGEDNE